MKNFQLKQNGTQLFKKHIKYWIYSTYGYWAGHLLLKITDTIRVLVLETNKLYVAFKLQYFAKKILKKYYILLKFSENRSFDSSMFMFFTLSWKNPAHNNKMRCWCDIWVQNFVFRSVSKLLLQKRRL
jgi:hypothetical protein